MLIARSDWSPLVYGGTIYGLVLSGALTTILIICGSIALDAFVDNYPPEIRQKYGPMSARAARLRPLFAGFVVCAITAVLGVGLQRVAATIGPLSFWSAFVFTAVALFVFNLFDLIVLDWLLFCGVQPRMMVLPGTEGMAAYRDYGFHFVGFLKGLGFTLAGGMIGAALWMVVQRQALSG
jgi:hypothetical protein